MLSFVPRWRHTGLVAGGVSPRRRAGGVDRGGGRVHRLVHGELGGMSQDDLEKYFS